MAFKYNLTEQLARYILLSFSSDTKNKIKKYTGSEEYRIFKLKYMNTQFSVKIPEKHTNKDTQTSLIKQICSNFISKRLSAFPKIKGLDTLRREIDELNLSKQNKSPEGLDDNFKYYSIIIDNQTINSVEVVVLMNIFGLFQKVTLKNCRINLKLSDYLYKFLQKDQMQTQVLNLRNTQIFLEPSYNEINKKYELSLLNEFLNEYNLSYEAYAAYKLLLSFNFISSLTEIHIKDQTNEFIQDLFKLVSRYCYNINRKSKIDFFYSFENSWSEVKYQGQRIKNFKENKHYEKNKNDKKIDDTEPDEMNKGEMDNHKDNKKDALQTIPQQYPSDGFSDVFTDIALIDRQFTLANVHRLISLSVPHHQKSAAQSEPQNSEMDNIRGDLNEIASKLQHKYSCEIDQINDQLYLWIQQEN